MKDREPIFISFVGEDELDKTISRITRMKEREDCVIVFNSSNKILGIGFKVYDHLLLGEEIFTGKTSFTLGSLMETNDIKIDKPKEAPSLDTMSLEEIEKSLVNDPELDNEERFEIYYKEYLIEKELNK